MATFPANGVPRVTRGHDPSRWGAPTRVRMLTGRTVALDSYCSADALAQLYYSVLKAIPNLPYENCKSLSRSLRSYKARQLKHFLLQHQGM